MGPVLGAVALLRHDPLPSRTVALLGASLGVLQLGVAYALFEGFARAPVALVTLLFFAYPLLTAVGAAAVFHEPLGPRRLGIIAVALAGIALTIGIPESATWVGVVLGLVAGIGVACLILSSRYLMTRHALAPLVLSSLMFTSPAIALVLVWPARTPDFTLSGEAWTWAACAVLVSAVIPIGLFYTGVSRIEAGVAGLLSSAEPLVSVFLAYAVLDETLSATQIVGGALIVVAVVLLSAQALPRRGGVRARPPGAGTG